MSDYEEVMTHNTNPLQLDSDHDGLSDAEELTLGLQPLNPDTDGDGLRDGFEIKFNLNAMVGDQNDNGILDGYDDFDGDGSSNAEEDAAQSEPLDPASRPTPIISPMQYFTAIFNPGTPAELETNPLTMYQGAQFYDVKDGDNYTQDWQRELVVRFESVRVEIPVIFRLTIDHPSQVTVAGATEVGHVGNLYSYAVDAVREGLEVRITNKLEKIYKSDGKHYRTRWGADGGLLSVDPLYISSTAPKDIPIIVKINENDSDGDEIVDLNYEFIGDRNGLNLVGDDDLVPFDLGTRRYNPTILNWDTAKLKVWHTNFKKRSNFSTYEAQNRTLEYFPAEVANNESFLNKDTTNSLFLEGIALGTSTLSWQVGTIAHTRDVAVVRVGLLVDYDRDGIIDDSSSTDNADRFGATIRNPYFFWVNDSDDDPEEVPESDYLNDKVDGVADLADFFPVFLDIKQLLDAVPSSNSVKYKLKHADGALNFIYTSLTPATAYDSTGFASATTQQITADGVELSNDFLTNIKDAGQGVILVEAREVSDSLLTLVVEKDDVQIAEVTLNIARLRLYTDPGTVHLGFDPPNKSEPDDLAAPSTYWASVVQGSTSDILNLDLPAGALSGVEWKIADGDDVWVDIRPKTFTAATTKLTIEGWSPGLNTPVQTAISLVPIGSTGPAILTLKVWVLPQREMALAIYVLEDPDAPKTQFANAPVVSLPSNTEILAVVNDSMKQAGVRFTLHPSSGTYSFP